MNIQEIKKAADDILVQADKRINDRALHKANRQKLGNPEQRESYKEAKRLKKELKEDRKNARELRKRYESNLLQRIGPGGRERLMGECLRGENPEKALQNLGKRLSKEDFVDALQRVRIRYQSRFRDLLEGEHSGGGMPDDNIKNVFNQEVAQGESIEDTNDSINHLVSLEAARRDLLQRRPEDLNHQYPTYIKETSTKREWWGLEPQSRQSDNLLSGQEMAASSQDAGPSQKRLEHKAEPFKDKIDPEGRNFWEQVPDGPSNYGI